MTTRRTCLQASSLLIPAGPLAHATQAGDLTSRPRSRIYRVRVDPISPLKADRHSLRLRYYFSIDVLRAAIQQGEEFTAQIEHHNLLAIRFHQLPATGRDFIHRRHYMARHYSR